jgi:hypothetical protein
MRGASRYFIAAACIAIALPAQAQSWLILQGIAEGEAWTTDSGSLLLTRNNGHPGVVGRLQVFAGVAPVPGVQLVALVAGYGGNANPGESDVELEGLDLRLSRGTGLMLDAGKLPSPVGVFAPRRFSPVNPLIGEPDAYPTQYPWGVQLTGRSRYYDYRIAVVSLPPVHDGYVPPPQPAPRLVFGGGVSPVIGVRVGGSFTRGPYLSDSIGAVVGQATTWKNFAHQVIAFDGRVSRGYFDFHGEWAYAKFVLPFNPPLAAAPSGEIAGPAYYAEVKYTWTPRFFTAFRFQRNDYPFLRHFGTVWVARAVNFYAGEIGAGFRLAPGLLAKISYQRDDWTDPSRRDGRALAVQFSWQFDATAWMSPRQ